MSHSDTAQKLHNSTISKQNKSTCFSVHKAIDIPSARDYSQER